MLQSRYKLAVKQKLLFFYSSTRGKVTEIKDGEK